MLLKKKMMDRLMWSFVDSFMNSTNNHLLDKFWELVKNDINCCSICVAKAIRTKVCLDCVELWTTVSPHLNMTLCSTKVGG